MKAGDKEAIKLTTYFHTGMLLFLFRSENGKGMFLWNMFNLNLLHDATSQKLEFIVATAARTSGPTPPGISLSVVLTLGIF